MFNVKGQKCLLKGLSVVAPGSFNSNGETVSYEGYNKVTVMVMNKNGKLTDLNCRIPSDTDGNILFSKLADVKLGSEITLDLTIEVSTQNNAKLYITNVLISK